MAVPFCEPAALYYEPVISFVMQEIMKYESFFWIMPPDNLAKPQVIKHNGVGPFFNSIQVLRKLFQNIYFMMVGQRVKQMFIHWKIAEIRFRIFIKNRSVSNIITFAITGNHHPEHVL